MRTPYNPEQGSTEGTLIRISCDRASISSLIPATQAPDVIKFATVLAQETCSERELAIFIRDQINGRDTSFETALAESTPGYAEDVGNKLAVFMVGLLAKRDGLAECIDKAFLEGGHVIDIQLSELHLTMQLTGRMFNYGTRIFFADTGGITITFH